MTRARQIARAQQAELAQLQHKQAQQKIAQQKKVDAATLAHKSQGHKAESPAGPLLRCKPRKTSLPVKPSVSSVRALRLLADREGSSQAPSATQSKRNRRAGVAQAQRLPR